MTTTLSIWKSTGNTKTLPYWSQSCQITRNHTTQRAYTHWKKDIKTWTKTGSNSLEKYGQTLNTTAKPHNYQYLSHKETISHHYCEWTGLNNYRLQSTKSYWTDTQLIKRDPHEIPQTIWKEPHNLERGRENPNKTGMLPHTTRSQNNTISPPKKRKERIRPTIKIRTS